MTKITHELTAENFGSTVQKDGIVFVDFWAPWCGPCKSFGPIFDAAATKYGDLTFAKVNTDDQQELAGTLKIRGVPTLMIFRDGILLFSQAGAMPAAALDQLVEQVQKLDMDHVRKELAARDAKKNPLN